MLFKGFVEKRDMGFSKK